MHYLDGCRTDILILFLNQDPNLLRSYVVRKEGIPLLGLLVCVFNLVYLICRSFIFFLMVNRTFIKKNERIEAGIKKRKTKKKKKEREPITKEPQANSPT